MVYVHLLYLFFTLEQVLSFQGSSFFIIRPSREQRVCCLGGDLSSGSDAEASSPIHKL